MARKEWTIQHTFQTDQLNDRNGGRASWAARSCLPTPNSLPSVIAAELRRLCPGRVVVPGDRRRSRMPSQRGEDRSGATGRAPGPGDDPDHHVRRDHAHKVLRNRGRHALMWPRAAPAMTSLSGAPAAGMTKACAAGQTPRPSPAGRVAEITYLKTRAHRHPRSDRPLPCRQGVQVQPRAPHLPGSP